MRRGFKKRIENSITHETSKYSDGEILKEFSCTSEFRASEFAYVKEKLERKYGFKFKDYYKRSHAVEEWEKIKESLAVVQKAASKKPAKPKVMNDDYWANACVDELSPTQALERFNKLKAEEKRQRLLEEVRNVDLFCNEVV